MFDKIKNSYLLTILSIVLVAAIVIGIPAGVISSVTSGEEYDCVSAMTSYNDNYVIYTDLTVGTDEQALSAELDALDSQLSSLLISLNIDALIYSDDMASLVTKLLGEITGKDFASIKFSSMKKQFPDAYTYLTSLQQSGSTWKEIEKIPFGIASGDKEAFIKACGAGGEHLGDALLNVILYEPTSYYDALVPALESTHTGAMPSIFGFVAKTGLSGSARIEFLAEKILSIIEPIKAAPLSYLCSIFPDFILSYNKACELINSNEKTGLSLPTIESIVSSLVSALGMTAPELDLTYISSMGVTSTAESAGNNGERVAVYGDREIIFAYLADYITSLFTYENNYAVVERILTHDVKKAEIQNLTNTAEAKAMIANLVDILQKLEIKNASDVSAEVENYNSEEKDFSSLFPWPFTEENVASTIDSLDGKLAQALATADLEAMLFTDEFATTISSFTAKLCNKELNEISFYALSQAYPDAYSYIKALQDSGAGWDDVETIPFGITPGDKEMFIKACGAGAEHFGDALALCLVVDSLSYDEALVPLLESLHTTKMPTLEEFVSAQGLDGAKRMENIVSIVLTILDPIKAAPISYLTEILPDLVSSYNKAAEAMSRTPDSPLSLPEIDELLADICSSFGLVLPEYDFSAFEKMGTAAVAESGSYSGKRMELKGDREVVTMAIVSYIADVIKYENNKDIIIQLATSVLGIDSQTADEALDSLEAMDTSST